MYVTQEKCVYIILLLLSNLSGMVCGLVIHLGICAEMQG